jgi:hypothetical protein
MRFRHLAFPEIKGAATVRRPAAVIITDYGLGLAITESNAGDELASEPQRLLRCVVPTPDRESRGRTGRPPSTPVRLRWGKYWPDEPTSGGRPGHKAQSPLLNALVTQQTFQIHQDPTGGVVTQNESAGIVALTAQTQQVLVQTQRKIEFTADRVIE